MRHVIDNNIGIFFEILNETEDDLEKYFLKEKEEYRRKLFLFWNLVGVYEAVIMPTDEPLFTDFYEAFYSGVDFLEYEIEKSYNIVGREFYSVMLKVKIGDKLIKKEWYFKQLPAFIRVESADCPEVQRPGKLGRRVGEHQIQTLQDKAA